ncbi:uncharacterized protein TNCT_202631 [Trichonephila clavata]|uniref:Uncharacterized protein n=1 Tax=Trichonephila clavata TaxID=2740835 RepID=A0A8X6JV51_TRICU|nr:uncharacterized protein TNCT_202631 [Trichonephila clavata]
METSQESVILPILFEHACKKEFNGVLQNVLQDKDLASKILKNSSSSESESPENPKINPVFMLIFILKKLNSIENFEKLSNNSDVSLPTIIDLLESTYKQYSFISCKKYFILMSELRLLDMINYVVDDSDPPLIIQKLNLHFPHWNAAYRTNIAKSFQIENSKILGKVEESHTQCRRLILRLAMDKSYRKKYLSEQYSNDISRLRRESKVYLSEVIADLESCAGNSSLEKIVNGEQINSSTSNDLGFQLLLDYIQPEISDEALVKFLDDFEPMLCSQPATDLSSCLLPMDTMSESDSESSEDEENSEDDESSKDACIG